jgi:arginyl-tRNA synthetase
MNEINRFVLRRAIEEAVAGIGDAPVAFEVSRARREQGEWTSNVALRAGKYLGRPASGVAQEIADVLNARAGACEGASTWRAEAVKGFVNFRMNDEALDRALEQARQDGDNYGRGDGSSGERVNVEWVSADPTGPLSTQAGRIAVSGEALCRLLAWRGQSVTREYFLNDDLESSKARSLGESVAAWYRSAFDDTLAKGLEADPSIAGSEWVRSVAREVVREEGNKWLLAAPNESSAYFAKRAREAAIASHKSSLQKLGVSFDVWTSEDALAREGRIQSALDALREAGRSYERDNATWLRSTEFGDQADRPLVRRGRPTYLATDIAYHSYKFGRGFARLVNIWNPQHGPYVARTHAALKAAGLPSESLQVLVCEGVRPRRDGIAISGEGSGVSIDQLLEDVPADFLKYFLVAPAWDEVAVVEVEQAAREDESNPAYALQLAPARLAMMQRELAARVSSPAAPLQLGDVNWTESEKALRRSVALWPDEVAMAAANLEPQRVARFALELAHAVRDDFKATRADQTFARSEAELQSRLALVQAAHTVASRALHLLGIAPRDQF